MSPARRLAFSALDLIPLLGEFRMIEPKFPFRQFFDFRFGVNASRFFNLPHPPTTSPSLTYFLDSTPSPDIRQTYFVLVSPIISQGNSRLPAQLSTQIFAFNATAPTLFFAPFRGYYRERI